MGLEFPHPLGLAAGFDKNARAYRNLLRLGFSHVEVGTVTPRPQPGNPKPRLFRLRADRAIINRFGFNSDGLKAVQKRLERRDPAEGVVGANIGCNKDTVDRLDDYLVCLRGLHSLADYITVNVSSPNTADLRSLQRAEPLRRLLGELMAARAGLPGPAKPLLVKLAPDLDGDQEEAVAEAVLDEQVDGMVLTNTTLDRPSDLRSARAAEAGGLSGPPLFERSTAILRRMRQRVGPALTLIGVGGIGDHRTARLKLDAGADLLQAYTSFVYQGPALIEQVAWFPNTLG